MYRLLQKNSISKTLPSRRNLSEFLIMEDIVASRKKYSGMNTNFSPRFPETLNTTESLGICLKLTNKYLRMDMSMDVRTTSVERLDWEDFDREEYMG